MQPRMISPPQSLEAVVGYGGCSMGLRGCRVSLWTGHAVCWQLRSGILA